MSVFHLVDVFAVERYAGNQLAVVESNGELEDAEMGAIAAELGFSETTFVESTASDGARVRIFTPTDEIPFAGHPTLGTAHILRERLLKGRPERVVLDLNVGDVPVEVEESDDGDVLWMRQQPPTFGQCLDREALAAVLGLEREAIAEEAPVQIVSTGLPTIVVPLRNRSALTSARIDTEAYDRLTADREAKNILAYCRNPRMDRNDLAVRVFAPGLGVPEDPATGSSNGCLAAFLVRYGNTPVTARVEQGYELGRPSLIHVDARDRGDSIEVSVGGRVIDVGRGELY
ncbi:MAG: PhzF family phenazine biosynthesis protein [Salinirussus sp.]